MPAPGLKSLLAGPPRLTLAVAESMTCGLVQARIGAISGASDFFQGGITAYSLDQKVRHLGVDRIAAEAVDCVSGPIAAQMARGACALFGADLGVATTGYAEVSDHLRTPHPYGWWALARIRPGKDAETLFGRVDCPGVSRTEAQERVTEAALAALIDWLRPAPK